MRAAREGRVSPACSSPQRVVSEALFGGAGLCAQGDPGSRHRRHLGLGNRSPRLGHRAVATARLTACAPDGCHVRAISADDLTALAASPPRFVGAELMGTALRVRCLSALAGDLALLTHIHRGEPTVALRTLGIIGRHLPLLGIDEFETDRNRLSRSHAGLAPPLWMPGSWTPSRLRLRNSREVVPLRPMPKQTKPGRDDLAS